jgi:hypothetical protein
VQIFIILALLLLVLLFVVVLVVRIGGRGSNLCEGRGEADTLAGG